MESNLFKLKYAPYKYIDNILKIIFTDNYQIFVTTKNTTELLKFMLIYTLNINYRGYN